ncbi:MAG: hypothetical protein ACE5HS_06385 [bacterium]
MLKKNISLKILIILFACLNTNYLLGGSFYSSKGVGLVRYFVSGRSVGMGGIGLAVADPYMVNYLNPASLSAISLTTISGNMIHEATDLKNSTQDAFITDTNVAGLQFLIPFKRNVMVLSIGVNPYSAIEYTFIKQDSISEKQFTQIISGDGGVNTATLSLSIRPFSRLYLGVTGLFYFGTLRNKWQVNFDTIEFRNSRDEVGQSFTAGSVRLGAIVKVLPNWSVGAVFSPAVTLDAKKTITLERLAEFSDFPKTDFEVPIAFGFGTALTIQKKLMFGIDYYTQKWSDTKDIDYVNDSQRIGVGLEFFPNGSINDSYFTKVAYRLGFYYHDLGLEEASGEKVTEIFGSIGLGLPIKWSAARIDLALEAGRRGSLSRNTFKESIIRITGSVSVGERWFYRGGNR